MCWISITLRIRPAIPTPRDSRKRWDLNLMTSFFVQPTRVVPARASNTPSGWSICGGPKIKLCVSTIPATKALPTKKMLRESAEHEGVDLRFVSTRVGADERQMLTMTVSSIYSLWDMYPITEPRNLSGVCTRASAMRFWGRSITADPCWSTGTIFICVILNPKGFRR